MKILPEKQDFLIKHVRDAIAINPAISIRSLQGVIEKNTGDTISDKYLSKLLHKIRRQAVVESDRTKINERLAQIRERHRFMIDHLSRMLYWKPKYQQIYGVVKPTAKDQMAAIKLISKLEISLFKAELDAGAYENKQTAIEEMLRQGVLPTQLQEQVVGVFRTWKLNSPERIYTHKTDS